MPSRWVLPLLAALLLATATVGEAQGRPVNAFGRQNLNFGPLLPGTRTTVSRLDAAGAGRFEIRGERLTEV